MDEPICVGCNKRPHEIPEYVDAARNETEDSGEPITPAQYVELEEGTLNSANGHFLCTDCYIAAGMPSSPSGWKAP